MLVDYHMHTPLCNHAEGRPEEYCRAAVKRGIPEIGFSDHCPMPPDYDPEWRMKRDELDRYVEMVREVQGKDPRLTVRLGLEADYHPGTEDYVREVIDAHPFDYVIGSVHYIGDWGFDNSAHKDRFEKENLYEVYRQYYELIVQLAETGLYDIVGHPDVVKKFGYRPTEDHEDLERRALEAVAKAGMALDINTSGLRRPCKEIYPSERILRAARELDIPVTLGSDAHKPEDVGEGFPDAVALLRKVGYSNINRYEKRRAEAVSLPSEVS